MADDTNYVARFSRYLELPSFTWSEWDSVGLVKQAIRNIELGNFDAAALVVDAMTRDDRIDGILQKRCEAVPSLPMHFEPGKKSNDKIVAATEDNYQCMLPQSAVAEISKWGLMCGLGVGQLLWAQKDGLMVPTMKVWHPRFVQFRWDTYTFWINTTVGQVELKHGDGQWVLYTPRGLDRAYMMGRVRSLYVPWLIRQWGWRDWARYDEVHGLPIRKAHVPTNAQDDDKARFLRECAALGSESVVRLPRDIQGGEETGFDLTLLEATGTSYESFGALMTEANSCLAINILGQNLSTEVKGGSFAAATSHSDVEAALVVRDAFALEACFKTGVLQPFTALNFGNPEMVCVAHYKTEPPEDAELTAKTTKELGDGISALTAAGVKVDADELMSRLNLPVTAPYEPQDTSNEKADKAAEAMKNAPPPAGSPSLKVVPKKLSSAKVDPTLEGQLYIDDLDENARKEGIAALGPDFAAILSAVEEATDLPSLRTALLARFKSMNPEALAKVLESALLLSELNGRHAIVEEVSSDA